MSAKLLELEIIDGENMLSLIGQFIDYVRGDVDRPFRLRVRLPTVAQPYDADLIYPDDEVGVNVYGITMHLGDRTICSFEGYLSDEDNSPDWLIQAMRRNESGNAITGTYDAHTRKGSLHFAEA